MACQGRGGSMVLQSLMEKGPGALRRLPGKGSTSPTQCASLRSHLRTAALRPAFDLETHETLGQRGRYSKVMANAINTQGLGLADRSHWMMKTPSLLFRYLWPTLYPCTMRCLGFLTRSPLRNAVLNHASCLE